MRLDRWLWYCRLSSSRDYAQQLATTGHLRIGGRVVSKAASVVRVGDVLTFADHRGTVRVLRVELLPERRGPAPEARTCYTDLLIDGAEGES